MSVVSSIIFCLVIVVTNGFKITDISDQRSAAIELQRIRGGQAAARNQFPYMVSLYMHPSNAFCGGSLITVSTALTAAHCVKQDETVSNWTSVVFGSLILDKYPPDEPYQIIQNATGVLWHPQFSTNFFSVSNDIGLVFFPAVTPSVAIAVISLPADASSDYTDAEVVLTGYELTVGLT